jgi:hypothetical protein
MSQFVALFRPTTADRIIDVGGYPATWLLLESKPSVLMVNLEDEHWKDGRLEKVRGDGRRLGYPDHSFDIAFSNSVIEHVGSWEDQRALAGELRRVARRYYVQTPNRHFPIETHVVAPFVQYLPPALAKRALRWITPWGWIHRPTPEYVAGFVDQTRLLTEAEMRELFPDATIILERVLGMTKSIIAVRSDASLSVDGTRISG